MPQLLKDFREFILRGNLVDLAGPECLSDISGKARRCAFCTAQVSRQAP